MPNAVARQSTYLFFDASGDLSVVAGQGDIGSVTFHANGESLVASPYATMRTLMDVLQDVHTTQGDITVEAAGGPARLAASAEPGKVLSADESLNLSEVTSEGSAFEPVWAKPWPDPFLPVQGFEIASNSGTGNTFFKVGQGFCHPKFRTGASGTQNDFTTDGKVLRFDTTFTGSWTKDITAAWAAGDTNGCQADGFSFSAHTPYYLFVIGRSEDSAIDFAIDYNIEGTGIAASTAIQTWADTAGGNKLFIRRIRTFVSRGSLVLDEQYSHGDWTYFAEPMQLHGTPAVAISATPAALAVGGPAEPHMALLHADWSGTAAANVWFYAQNNFNKATAVAPRFAVARSAIVQDMGFQFNQFIDTDREVTITLSAGSDLLRLTTMGYEDPRGRYMV
jgi:hypothetical protein